MLVFVRAHTLEEYLQDWRTLLEIAMHFDLSVPSARAAIRRKLREEKVERRQRSAKGKPFEYRWVDS